MTNNDNIFDQLDAIRARYNRYNYIILAVGLVFAIALLVAAAL